MQPFVRLSPILAVARRSFSDLTSSAVAADSLRRGGGGGGKDTLGRRLLSLIFPKRSALVVLRKWAEEGKTVQKYQLNRVVRELRKHNRYKHALEICEWMIISKEIKLLPGDYAMHLDLVAKVRGLASAEKFFDDLPDRLKGQSTHTALLHTFVQNKLSSKAESLMEEMSTHGFLNCVLPFNHMIDLYINTGELDKIPEVIRELKKYTTPDVFTYNLLLTACSVKDDIEGAEDVFADMTRMKVTPDWVTYSLLTSIYTKAYDLKKEKEISEDMSRRSYLDKAREALEEMERRVSRKERRGYSSLISLHANLADKDNVFRIWRKMKSMFRKMSDAEYKCMLTSLVRLHDIKEAEVIYSEWENVSSTRDSRVPNILLGFYARHGMMGKAETLYEHNLQQGIKPSYLTWENLGLGYLHKKRIDKALDCFEKALVSVETWEPDDGLVKTVFHKLENLGDVEGAERFLKILRNAGYVTTEIYNFVLRTYAKAGKMPLIIAERMGSDDVKMNDETLRLIEKTRNFCVGSVSALI